VRAMSRDEISMYIVGLAQMLSGAKKVSVDDRVYADLRLSGSDAVEFYDKIEKRFGVDLRPVTETRVEVGSGVFGSARYKNIARDPHLNELCSFIEGQLP
jgi:hypothetical protein